MLTIEKIKAKKTIQQLIKFGVINIDKPTGPTSFSVSDYLRKTLNINKTSHMGTLDPAVTGVLPITLGRACRLSDYFMHRNKTYIGVMRTHKEITENELKKEIQSFIGTIKQLPPVRSRVKREIREREILSFTILEKEGNDFLFETEVQAGTYIRKLIHDLGEKIGGAHMLELRRTKAGLFDESSLVSLYDLDKAVESYEKGDEQPLRNMVFPAEIVALLLPSITIKESFLKKALTGSPLFTSSIEKAPSLDKDEKVVVFCKDTLVGCYKVINEGDTLAVPECVFN
ncbi:MAG TPA: RNA-guided pseudouridylation complex pseudouridine synthase subunit Cbf5 [Candidatus Nanoarchaeia archaeon]|nr:RNA-guided pseudouridylation complex pseudouridine synthase subunit Cbf5 [Candidatus Nanoarchaeia archaeon]